MNPTEGRPVSSGTHHPGVEVGDAIALAMAQILPDRCAPQTYKYGSPRQMWGEHDPRSGQPFFDHGGEVNAGWVNGVRGVDGWGALVASNGNLIKASAEINEALFPHLLRGRDYLTDSGGAGQWRGGCGSNFVKEVRTPTFVNQYVVNRRHLHPGIAGGQPGSPDACLISAGTEREVEVAPSVAEVRMETGDRLVYRFGGGGGWGDPLARDPDAVLDDVWDEYVSVGAARDEYGVVITGSLEDLTLAVDREATRAAARGPVRAPPAPERDGRPPHRRRRRRHVHRRGARAPRRVGDLREDPDDAPGPVRGGAGRPGRAGRRGGHRPRRPAGPHPGHRPRHHDRRQPHDPDDRRAHRAARHGRVPGRDRAAPLLQGGHLGPGVPAADADRPPAGAPRGPGAPDPRRGGGDPPRRGGGPGRHPPPAGARGHVDRGRVPPLLPEPGARASGPGS